MMDEVVALDNAGWLDDQEVRERSNLIALDQTKTQAFRVYYRELQKAPGSNVLIETVTKAGTPVSA